MQIWEISDLALLFNGDLNICNSRLKQDQKMQWKKDHQKNNSDFYAAFKIAASFNPCPLLGKILREKRKRAGCLSPGSSHFPLAPSSQQFDL